MSSVATVVVGRAYVRRTASFRFGTLGTTVLLALIWAAVFVVTFALGTNSWTNIK